MVAAAAGIASAVEFTSKVKMGANVANDAGEAVEFFKVNTTKQKDDDTLIFTFSGEKAGAQFKAWYAYDGSDGGQKLGLRGANIWFKPIDMLKVTVGNVGIGSYVEQIFWWHGFHAGAPASWTAYGGNYLEGVGAVVALDPIENLTIEAGIMPGIDTAFLSTADSYGYKGYALKAKYGFGPGSATVVFADHGKDAIKLIGIGADFSGVEGLYAFANVTIGLNDGLQSVAIDDYVKYSTGALSVQAHLPIALFKSGDAFKFGLGASVKASYAMGAFTPYLLISNEPDGDNGWVFDDNFKFFMTFKPGVTFNVGEASFDVAFRADVNTGAANDYDKFNWKIPVDISISL
jgi:hypothetical protein